MEWAAAVTVKRATSPAVADLVEQIQRRQGTGPFDLGFVFMHPSYFAAAGDLADELRSRLRLRHLIGCSGAGIIGLDQEIEHEPAISMLVGRLPHVTMSVFTIDQDQLEQSSDDPSYWQYQFEIAPAQRPVIVLFSDPFSVHPIELVNALTAAFPASPIVGGLVSGGRQPGQVRLFLDDVILDSGAVGVALAGSLGMRTIVSQGCRPIGEPLIITRAEKNIIYELAGRPPIEILHDLLPKLPEADQQLARKALFLGRVINEYRDEYRRGDFLIRNLIGQDPGSGALAVGDLVRTGQTVQFHVRDGQAAADDLREALQACPDQPPVRGALLFSCLGRGENMYGQPHHDVRALRHRFADVPTAGFFCSGEIGPVGERAYVHGFTSVFGLFTSEQPTATGP